MGTVPPKHDPLPTPQIWQDERKALFLYCFPSLPLQVLHSHICFSFWTMVPIELPWCLKRSRTAREVMLSERARTLFEASTPLACCLFFYTP